MYRSSPFYLLLFLFDIQFITICWQDLILTSIPACRKNRCAEKNDRYFDFKHLKIVYTLISLIFFFISRVL
jgi:hypothetical protein